MTNTFFPGNKNQFIAGLHEALRSDEVAPPLALKGDCSGLSAIFQDMARSTDRIVQKVHASHAVDEEALAVASMTASELATAIISTQVPNMAGSPVGILMSQDNLAILRRLGRHRPSVLIVDVGEAQDPMDINVINNFILTRKVKDVDLTTTAMVLTGNLVALPEVLRETINYYDLSLPISKPSSSGP